MTPAKLRRNWERTADRFGNIAASALARQFGRAVRLHLFSSAARAERKPERPERIVVSLSTIPARARMLGPVLRSLLDQDEPADRILLALPRRSRRDGTPYPAPETLGLPPGVEVLRCEDQGPATKFLPALQAEPDALMVVVDDDVVYPRAFLRELLAAHRRRPAAALGLRGVRHEPGRRFADLRHVFGTGIRADTTVDILFGTWGYLLPLKAGRQIPSVPALTDEVRWVDDIWLSAQLARTGIPRYVTPVSGLPLETLATLRGSLSGGVNRTGVNEAAALAAFADCWESGAGKATEAET